jgi:hypothetical protein
VMEENKKRQDRLGSPCDLFCRASYYNSTAQIVFLILTVDLLGHRLAPEMPKNVASFFGFTHFPSRTHTLVTLVIKYCTPFKLQTKCVKNSVEIYTACIDDKLHHLCQKLMFRMKEILTFLLSVIDIKCTILKYTLNTFI